MTNSFIVVCELCTDAAFDEFIDAWNNKGFRGSKPNRRGYPRKDFKKHMKFVHQEERCAK